MYIVATGQAFDTVLIIIMRTMFQAYIHTLICYHEVHALHNNCIFWPDYMCYISICEITSVYEVQACFIAAWLARDHYGLPHALGQEPGLPSISIVVWWAGLYIMSWCAWFWVWHVHIYIAEHSMHGIISFTSVLRGGPRILLDMAYLCMVMHGINHVLHNMVHTLIAHILLSVRPRVVIIYAPCVSWWAA